MMTREEAADTLRKFEEVVREQFRLTIMNIQKDASLGDENIRKLVACVHEALPDHLLTIHHVECASQIVRDCDCDPAKNPPPIESDGRRPRGGGER